MYCQTLCCNLFYLKYLCDLLTGLLVTLMTLIHVFLSCLLLATLQLNVKCAAVYIPTFKTCLFICYFRNNILSYPNRSAIYGYTVEIKITWLEWMALFFINVQCHLVTVRNEWCVVYHPHLFPAQRRGSCWESQWRCQLACRSVGKVKGDISIFRGRDGE